MKLQQKGEQFYITIPRDLITALSWKKGNIITFLLDKRARIVLTKKDQWLKHKLELGGLRPSRVKRYFDELKDKK